MGRNREARRLIGLFVWCVIFASGILVGTWGSEHGPAVLGRLAAWSERRPADRPAAAAPPGARPGLAEVLSAKRRMLDRPGAEGATPGVR
jgi:hypothetical protein